MKAVTVIFVRKKVENNFENYRKYTFNSEIELNVGDILMSPCYHDLLQVIEVSDETKLYMDLTEGVCTNQYKPGLIRLKELLPVENLESYHVPFKKYEDG